jgi:fumarate reductase subunit C
VAVLAQVLQARLEQTGQTAKAVEAVGVLVVVVSVVQAALALSSFHTQTYMRRQQQSMQLQVQVGRVV